MYWTQRDGTIIKISDMTNRHLLNSIDMLNRRYIEYKNDFRYNEADQWVPEYESPGEMFDSYDDLMAEAKKRGIKQRKSQIKYTISKIATNSADICERCGCSKSVFADDYFIPKCNCIAGDDYEDEYDPYF